MKKFKCVLCGCNEKGITVHDFKMGNNPGHGDIDWQLCPNCSHRWIRRHLTPDEVLKVRKLAKGDTFHTHDDFYDESGESLQPC